VESFDLSNHESLLVASAIIASVALISILIVVVYAVKFRKYHKRRAQLEMELAKNNKGIEMIRSSLGTMEQLNSTQLQEIERYKKDTTKSQRDINIQQNQINYLGKELESSQQKVASLQKDNTKLQSELSKSKENLFKANEKVESAIKRNEFWVAQVSELRIKYNALNLKKG